MYLSIDQVAHRLHKSNRQVRYLMEKGWLTPVNQQHPKRDGGFRFREEDVKELEESLTLKGLTVKETAQHLKLTPEYVLTLIGKGEIASFTQTIGNQKRRLVKLEEIERYRSEKNNDAVANRMGEHGRKMQLISREAHIFEEAVINGVMARIVDLAPLRAMTETGEIVEPEEYKSNLMENNKPYLREKGYVNFSFPMPRHPNHPTYHALFKMIRQLGAKNIQIFEQQWGDYFVKCRQGLLELLEDEYRLLQRSIISGQLIPVTGGYQLTSDEVEVKVNITRNMLTQYDQLAHKKGKERNDILFDALSHYLGGHA
ncbi:hypothetical protein N781_02850 [Pontibacillus halophilus JSM 076056 = DSM 19796]|uniref:Helix-turn-helix domain-containing protein n=1 Tax=Pontibacillus halophilus JSM 076056 = DSM 19796 TaxID=1385510 RepID=A0A0A5GLQ0_9BACI|nr:hypothetical protein [Pontibacillus halophilus]KGX92070.1 hypothetical protein N781_02850 [Pontibacillus halophilus JSM 076056 = DSM 19796]